MKTSMMLEEVYQHKDDDARKLADEEQLQGVADQVPVKPSHRGLPS